ncbi:hypothetical protein DPMN_094799 [Dreissena polymorpha]|uniref:Uncharacterized protein n=1 Tax=Dreissena polymorpha TaxID=45954 RepID=A0A9D4L6D8_DREPO|nr:hypothetical protein DPMN_094799 [Dreissena polymorpha]
MFIFAISRLSLSLGHIPPKLSHKVNSSWITASQSHEQTLDGTSLGESSLNKKIPGK